MVPSNVVDMKVSRPSTTQSDDEDRKQKKLMDYCRDGNMEILYSYCMNNAMAICNAVNLPIDEVGNVPLHLTVSQNDHVMTCILLLKGANPDIANVSGVRPLAIATRMGFTKIEALLLRVGAKKASVDINSNYKILQRTNFDGQVEPVQPINQTQGLFGSFSSSKATKLSFAEVLDEEGKEIVQAALETGVMTLPDAAYLGFEKELEEVIRRENIEDQDEEGASLLMKASYRGHLSLVKRLLECECDADTNDKAGNTAMVWAALGGHLKVVQALHNAGANIDGAVAFCKKQSIFLKGQLTPLVAAAYLGYNEILEYLINQQCDVNLRCGAGRGKSAILAAAWNLKKDTVSLLLQHKAYVDPNVDNWLIPGIIKMKRLNQEKNPWMNYEQAKNPTNTPVRRGSLQEKMGFLTPQESEIVGEIRSMLATRAGVSVNQLNDTLPSPEKIQKRAPSRRNTTVNRQGINLEKIIGSNYESIMSLAEQIPTSGTKLDCLWIDLFQCVVQIIMAANKNIKHQYIAISAKIIHYSAEIVRQTELAESKLKYSPICDTLVRAKTRKLGKIILSEYPKQLMLSTRMAIGVWPPPNAISDMVKEAASLAATCREFVLLANTLGWLPYSPETLDVSFKPFEETLTNANTEPQDSSLKGGLSYSEYKRQNDLKLIEQMSKKYELGANEQISEQVEEEILADAKFTESLDLLGKKFVSTVKELQNAHEQHLSESFINITSNLNEIVDNLMEEILNCELLRDLPEIAVFNENDLKRLATMGVKITVKDLPTPVKIHFRQAFDDIKAAAAVVLAKGKAASEPLAPTLASTEMLKSVIPCGIAVKKLIILAKEILLLVRSIGTEERRKKEEWKRECLANERVKAMFHMWESQVIGESQSGPRKNQNLLTQEELDMLNDSAEGLIFDESSKLIKGGRIGKLVEYVTSHEGCPGNVTFDKEESCLATLFLTHHSFCTSITLIEQLFKRYEITPPYGLTQRMFEIYLDKKVVQVRLKVCNALLYWVQNHFTADFVDNELLILRFKEFISKKVMADFEHMSVQILGVLEQKLSEQDLPKKQPVLLTEKDRNVPKPILPATKFGGADPLAHLLSDYRNIYEIDPLEMARQLTLIEHELYCKVKSYECLDQIWESHYRKEMAGTVKTTKNRRHLPGSADSDISKLISHTNDITFFVSTCIVNNENVKYCRELNNLTGVTTIVAGLTMGPVGRLHKTWEMLDDKNPKVSEIYKELSELVSPKFQYAKYRAALKEMVPPAIPFLGVYLTDLTFIELGNPDYLPDSHYINFDKRRKVYNLVKEIQRFQQTPYLLATIPQISDLLRKICEPRGAPIGWEESNPIMTEEELYAKSLEVEPKEESSDEDNEA